MVQGFLPAANSYSSDSEIPRYGTKLSPLLSRKQKSENYNSIQCILYVRLVLFMLLAQREFVSFVITSVLIVL
jgi:hypothetical protein